ncbi:IS110 family transposase, partial [Mycobacteroides abscessus]|uniref:IS110 family transposase n=1 Tax=Mycobacteroides abscessus TaxID=36809 RepID=UPI0014038BD2
MARKTSPVHIGIDTSKRELVVASRPAGTAFTVSNTMAGITVLVDRLVRLKPLRIAIEPSGGFEHAVVQALRQAGLPVQLVNPRKLR